MAPTIDTSHKTKMEIAAELKGITPEAGAKLARVSESYWRQLSKGEIGEPGLFKARRVAKVLGFTADELWPSEDE